MIKIGSTAVLTIQRITPYGAFLEARGLGEILLPKRFVTTSLCAGDQIEVFIHKDSEDRLVATTEQPIIEAGQCALLKINQVTEVGAFADIGLDKELLIPFAQQHKPLEAGRKYLVYCFLNPVDQRLVGSTKVDRFIGDTVPDSLSHVLIEGAPVSLIVGPRTDLGTKVLVNQTIWGLIHQDQIFKPLSFGQSIKGFIRAVRPDGKLNIGLNKAVESRLPDAETIYDYLLAHSGACHLNDKSSPEAISSLFGMSKAAFKRAIGHLYREKRIQIKGDGIYITEKG